MGISEQSTLLCEQKLLTSLQIFRYAVPARTVTKKALEKLLRNFKFQRQLGLTLHLNLINLYNTFTKSLH